MAGLRSCSLAPLIPAPRAHHQGPFCCVHHSNPLPEDQTLTYSRTIETRLNVETSIPISWSDITEAFWCPTIGRVIDAVHPITGAGVWSKLTLVQLRQRHGEAIATVSCKQVVELSHKAERERYCTQAVAVTAERADDALNVLPPYRWSTVEASAPGSSWEAFAIGEPLTDRLRDWFVRIGNQWFSLVEDRAIDYQALLALVRSSESFITTGVES